MAERTATDLHVEAVMRRLEDDLVDADGQPAEPKFVNLLVEHQARDQLRERGLHRDVDGAAEDAKGTAAGRAEASPPG